MGCQTPQPEDSCDPKGALEQGTLSMGSLASCKGDRRGQFTGGLENFLLDKLRSKDTKVRADGVGQTPKGSFRVQLWDLWLKPTQALAGWPRRWASTSLTPAAVP